MKTIFTCVGIIFGTLLYAQQTTQTYAFNTIENTYFDDFKSRNIDALASNPGLKYFSPRNIQLNGEKLTQEEIREFLEGYAYALELYDKGMINRKIGNILLGGGIGLFIGNGIGNMMNSNNGGSKNPTLLFYIGGGIAATGIIIKLSANETVKESIWHYNREKGYAKKFDSQINLAVNSDGIGLQLTF